MDFDLMITSFPKLLGATVVTLKLLFASLFFYSFAAVLYLMLTFLSMQLLNRLETKYSKGY